MASDSHAKLVWVNTMPWIETVEKWKWFARVRPWRCPLAMPMPHSYGAYHWRCGPSQERSELVNFFEEHGLSSKLVMLSGDAHMVAADNGTATPGRFPVFHASALDQRPSLKGGPYRYVRKTLPVPYPSINKQNIHDLQPRRFPRHRAIRRH